MGTTPCSTSLYVRDSQKGDCNATEHSEARKVPLVLLAINYYSNCLCWFATNKPKQRNANRKHWEQTYRLHRRIWRATFCARQKDKQLLWV